MCEWLNKTICSEDWLEGEKNNISVWKILEKKAVSAPAGSNGVFLLPILLVLVHRMLAIGQWDLFGIR